MAVVAVDEIWDGRTGRQSLEGRRREYTRVFEVTTDSATDGPVTAIGTGAVLLGLPVFAAVHPEDVGAIVLDIDPQQSSDSPYRWTVSVRYSSDFGGANGAGGEASAQPATGDEGGEDGTEEAPADMPENPFLRPAVWKITFQQDRRPLRQGYRVTDVGGVPTPASAQTAVRNSAKTMFDPTAEYDVSFPVLSITVNRPVNAFRLDDLLTLQDRVNEAEWFGLPERCARCIGVEMSSKYENGFAYVEMTYTIAIRYETWDIQILDSSYEELIDGDPPRYKKMLDSQGREPSGPWPLDGSGHKLNPNSSPVYLRWSVYESTNFSTKIYASPTPPEE